MVDAVSGVTGPRAGGLIADALGQAGRPLRFGRGQALFAEGDGAERVFLVEQGAVLLSCVASDGRELVLGVLGPGDIIGELSVLDGKPRSATALALDDVHVIVVSAGSLLLLLDDRDATRELIRMLAARLRDGNRKRIEFATLNTLGRVAWRLLELSERFGEPTPEGVNVALPLSQHQLASWCGASREATVRALATLRSLQVIKTGRHRMLIRDGDSLGRHAHGQA